MKYATRLQPEQRLKRFQKFLASNGAEVLPVTNEWELVRFNANGVTSIVYKNKRGNVTYVGEAHAAATPTSARSGRLSSASSVRSSPQRSSSKTSRPSGATLRGVWRELRSLGFRWARPCLHSAAAVGAPHLRKRLFLFAAHPEREGLEGWAVQGRERADQRAARPGRRAAPHPDRGGREGERRGWVFDCERQTLRPHVDGRGVRRRRGRSFWDVESPVLRVADGLPERVDQLRAAGNAVIPQVAEAAFRALVQDWTQC